MLNVVWVLGNFWEAQPVANEVVQVLAHGVVAADAEAAHSAHLVVLNAPGHKDKNKRENRIKMYADRRGGSNDIPK